MLAGCQRKANTFALLVLMALLLSACNTSEFLYNRADWLIARQVGNYVDMTSTQRQRLDGLLDELLNWHRASEIPRYADYLDNLRADVAGDLSAEHIERRLDEGYVLWQRLMREVKPGMLDLLQSLHGGQVEQLLANVDAEQRRPEVDPHDDQAVARERAENFERSLRRWLGRLNDEQRHLVKQWAAAQHNTYPLAIEHQRQWRDRLAEALERRHHREALAEAVDELFLNPGDLWSEEYRRQLAENRRRTAELLAELHGRLEDHQQRRLLRRLEGYRDDFERIARRG
jgi:hypothetical protein